MGHPLEAQSNASQHRDRQIAESLNIQAATTSIMMNSSGTSVAAISNPSGMPGEHGIDLMLTF